MSAHYRELGGSASGDPKFHSEERAELHLSKRQVLSVFAGLLLAMPIWAAHTNNVVWNVSSPITIGGTEVKPGNYVIRIDDGATQAEVLSHGKTVAQVPVQWTQLSSKAQDTEVDEDGGKVTQIKIAGKTSAVTFSN